MRFGRNSDYRFTVVVFLILIYPLLSMLWHHDYPIFSIEISQLAAIFLLLAGLFSVLMKSVRPLVVNFALVSLLTLSFIIQFNPLFIAIVMIFTGGLIVSLVLGKHFSQALLAVICAMIMGAFIDSRLDKSANLPPGKPATADIARGPLIHILVDGFIGPDGLPRSEESLGLREDMMAFFEEHGFEIHTRAYTHYASTVDSMTRALNFRNDNENIFHRVTTLREPMAVRENTWFRVLEDHGYPIVVYQSESVSYCDAKSEVVARCNVFPIPNLKTVHSDVSSMGTRLNVLLRTLVRQSNILNDLLLKVTGQWGVTNYDRRMLEQMSRDLWQAPGNMYFAHLLLPHQPMVFQPDCSLDYDSDPWQRFAVFDGLVGNSKETQQMRYRRYAANAKCALSELSDLFGSLREMGLYEQATIVVHGDHGGPIFRYAPFTQNANRLSMRDLRETYSTLFAVKRPGGHFSINEQMTSLNVLMMRMLSEITGEPAEQLGKDMAKEDEPFIYLSGTTPLTRVAIDFFNE
jgi:hypothetical protein